MRLAKYVCQSVRCVHHARKIFLRLALPPPDFHTKTHRSCFRSKRQICYKRREMPDKDAGAVEHEAAEKATENDPYELQGRVCVAKVRTDGT